MMNFGWFNPNSDGLPGLGITNEGENIFNDIPDQIVFLEHEDLEFLATVGMKW